MMEMNNKSSIKLNGSDVVRYKERLYSARWANTVQGYFLVPINEFGESLGFWAAAAKCTILKN